MTVTLKYNREMFSVYFFGVFNYSSFRCKCYCQLFTALFWAYLFSVFLQLRNQAENELRALRAELTQKKINVTLSRRGQREDNPDLYTPRSQQPISSRT